MCLSFLFISIPGNSTTFVSRRVSRAEAAERSVPPKVSNVDNGASHRRFIFLHCILLPSRYYAIITLMQKLQSVSISNSDQCEIITLHNNIDVY